MIYDYRNEEIIQDVVLEDYEDIVDDIVEEYVGLRRYDTLYMYAPSYIVKEILPSLIQSDLDFYVHENSHNELLQIDRKLILLTINNFGEIFIEDAYERNKLKQPDGVLNYIHDSISIDDLHEIVEFDSPILVFGFEDDDFEEKNDDYEVYVTVDDEGVPHGFSATWFDECNEGCSCYQSYSVYSTCPTRVAELAESLGIDLLD